jgi:hypothetical protein
MVYRAGKKVKNHIQSDTILRLYHLSRQVSSFSKSQVRRLLVEPKKLVGLENEPARRGKELRKKEIAAVSTKFRFLPHEVSKNFCNPGKIWLLRLLFYQTRCLWNLGRKILRTRRERMRKTRNRKSNAGPIAS